MIDVHVLTHEGTRPDWLAECLRSLESEPCTVHLVDNTGRKVGPGRTAGYKMGVHPLVSYVDSDDFVFPGAMQAVIDGLEHHTSVCTRELAIHNGVGFFKLPRGGHNLFAARRDAIEPLLAHMERRDGPTAPETGASGIFGLRMAAARHAGPPQHQQRNVACRD